MAIVKQGTTTLNSGAKGDRGEPGVSGGSNGNITPVTSLAELLALTVNEKIIDIQAPITLLANHQILAEQWIFSTGYIDIGAFELDFNGASLNFNSKIKGLDLSGGTVIGTVTMLNDILYASNIGALDDDTSDNWQSIYNALHIVNQNGATLKFNRQTATGIYYIRVYNDDGNVFFTDGFGNDKTLVIGNRNYGDSYDNIEVSSESGVKIRTFADDEDGSSVFSLYNTKNSKILNNHFIGDRDSHFYDQRLRINTGAGATSNGVLNLRMVEFEDYKDTQVSKTVTDDINISVGTQLEVANEIITQFNASAAFTAAGYSARLALESETPTTDTDERVIIRVPAGTYSRPIIDGDTSGAVITADTRLYEWGHCIVQDSRAVDCEIGYNIIEKYHGDGVAKSEQGNGTVSIEFSKGDLTAGFIDDNGDVSVSSDYYYSTERDGTLPRPMPTPHQWFQLEPRSGQTVDLLHYRYWMIYYDADGNFLEKSPQLTPFDVYDYPTEFKQYRILIENYGTDLYEPLTGEFNVTSGTKDLTSTTFVFDEKDIGKTVVIVGAGAVGSDLTTTIKDFINSSTVELTDFAGTTVVNADGNLSNFIWFINSPSIPRGGVIHHNKFIENRRHGITNVLSYQIVEHNEFYRNSGVLPQMDLNIEDWGKKVQGQIVRFNTFSVTNYGSISVKGCNRVHIYGNNFIQGSTALAASPQVPAIIISFARNTQIYNNFFESRGTYVDILTSSHNNHYTDSNLILRSGSPMVSNETFVNSRVNGGVSTGTITEGLGGDGGASLENSVFYINDDWGNGRFIDEANTIRFKNIRYFFNDKVTNHNEIANSELRDVYWSDTNNNYLRSDRTTLNNGGHEGTYEQIYVYGAKVSPSVLHKVGWTQYAAPTKNFYLESSLAIQNGYEKSFKIKDGEIQGWFWLELGEYASDGLGDFETITIEDVDVIVPPNISANEGYLDNSIGGTTQRQNLLRVTQDKNVNLVFKNCSFISKDTTTGLFMYLGNQGTTDFIGCTFDAPQAENIDFTSTGAERTIGIYASASHGAITIKDAITPSNRITFTGATVI